MSEEERLKQRLADLSQNINSLIIEKALSDGKDLRPTIGNAISLGLLNSDGSQMQSNRALDLVGRFASGVLHGAVNMVWQPIANTIDLGQVGVGLASGGSYEPKWLSGIGTNYQAGLSYGETVTRAVLGSNPITGVGIAGYDMTSSALNGDWGGVAEGAGGLAGGFVAGKYGQRAFALEAGAQLGIYRVRPQVEVTNPLVDPAGLLPPLSKWDAPNFISAEPVYIGNKPLYRVSDGVFDSRTQANVNGAYWADRPAPASEGLWRSAYACSTNGLIAALRKGCGCPVSVGLG